MKHGTLNEVFAKLEKQRADLFAQLSAYDDKVLNQKPSETGWSVMEVVDHLIVAENFTFQYLDKKTKDLSSAQKVGLKEAFRSVLLNAYLGSSKKFRAPEISIPSGKYTATGSSTRWQAN